MSGWQEDEDKLLTKLWRDDGLSAGQCAARLKGRSRNAVIGRVHRLGLNGCATLKRTQRAAPRRTNSTKVAPAPRKSTFNTSGTPKPKSAALFRANFVAEAFVAHEELDIPLKDRKRLVDLTEQDCHWPIGDPRHDDFHFCNRHKVPGLPYCEFHARRAFQPPQPRRRDIPAPSGTPMEPAANPVKSEEMA